jgi:protein-disulfide isomerase
MEGRGDERERLRAERHAAESQEAATVARKRRLQYLIIGGFAAIAVIVALIVISQSGGDGDSEPPSNLQGSAEVAAELDGIPQDGTILGDRSAEVSVIEFGDLQCPVCAAFATQLVPQLISSEVRPGNVTYEYRNWDIIGPDSEPASKAALAAGEQDRFFQFIQLFYVNQGGENSGYVTDAFLEKIARGAGVPDIEKWNADRKSSKWDAVLAKNNDDAESLGFTGTPSILVTGPNGQQALKGFGLDEIEAAIQQVS